MVTHVAAAILQRNNTAGQTEFLLASRPQGKPWAGWWEFPGGKIEAGESAEHALIRELQEELGITPRHIQPWLTRTYDYPATHDSAAKTVKLHFFFVTAWQGALLSLENQQLSWQNPQNITVSPILPANAPIIKALALPPIYAISNMAEMGESVYLTALQAALNKGLRLIQVREKQLDLLALEKFATAVIALAKPFGAKVLINEHIELAQQLGADGVHLPSPVLMRLNDKPANMLVAASCHHLAELQQAEKLGLDFAVLSPVLPTLSHAGAPTLGWDEFRSMLTGLETPIYALGGMSPDCLALALQAGARGIAMQRAAWV